MIHLYTGNGKGKTTAAVGMAVRAAGHGMKVLFCQFMKDGTSGELLALRKLNVEIWCSPVMHKMTFQMNHEEFEQACDNMHLSVRALSEKIASLHSDLVIFDELATALGCGMIGDEDARELLQVCGSAEMIVTGRNAPEWLKERADYLCVVESLRHPYEKGISARQGIEW